MGESTNPKPLIPPPFKNWRLCGHCCGTGTCTSGTDNASCFSCAGVANALSSEADRTGLVCSVCHGHGCGAPMEIKVNNLMTAAVTAILEKRGRCLIS